MYVNLDLDKLAVIHKVEDWELAAELAFLEIPEAHAVATFSDDDPAVLFDLTETALSILYESLIGDAPSRDAEKSRLMSVVYCAINALEPQRYKKAEVQSILSRSKKTVAPAMSLSAASAKKVLDEAPEELRRPRRKKPTIHLNEEQPLANLQHAGIEPHNQQHEEPKMNQPAKPAAKKAAKKTAEKKADKKPTAKKASTKKSKSTDGRPTEGTVGDKIFQVCDKLFEKNGETKRADVIARCVSLGIKAASASAGYQHWRKFKGMSGRG